MSYRRVVLYYTRVFTGGQDGTIYITIHCTVVLCNAMEEVVVVGDSVYVEIVILEFKMEELTLFNLARFRLVRQVKQVRLVNQVKLVRLVTAGAHKLINYRVELCRLAL